MQVRSVLLHGYLYYTVLRSIDSAQRFIFVVCVTNLLKLPDTNILHGVWVPKIHQPHPLISRLIVGLHKVSTVMCTVTQIYRETGKCSLVSVKHTHSSYSA